MGETQREIIPHRMNTKIENCNGSIEKFCLLESVSRTSDSVMKQDMAKPDIEWNSDTIYALGPYKLIWRILGIWPLDSDNLFSKIRFVTIVILEVIMVFSLIGEMFTECLIVSDVGAIMSWLGVSILSFLKIVLLRVSFRPQMLEIVVAAIDDWATVKSPDAYAIMRKHAKFGRLIFIYEMSFACTSASLLVIGGLSMPVSLVNNGTLTNLTEIGMNGSESFGLRGFPHSTVCLYGEISNAYYYALFTLQSVQSYSSVVCNVGNDVCFFGIMMHLCSQFQLLGKELQQFGVNDVGEEKGREELAVIIQRHVKLNKLAENIEVSYCFIILMQFSANASQICMLGIQMILSWRTGDKVMIINSMICLTIITAQLYLYCYAGDRLSSEIEKLGESVYFSPWYDLPSKLVKEVPFLIMHNHKKFYITAGKVYRIDIDNFKNLMKTLGSYFSVLRVMFDT